MAAMSQKHKDPRLEYVLYHLNRLGVRFPIAELSNKLEMSKGNISGMLNGKRPISESFFTGFCKLYKLDGTIKPSLPGDPVNKERALIKVLIARVAKLEAARLGLPVDAVLDEIERDTMIAWNDLEKM